MKEETNNKPAWGVSTAIIGSVMAYVLSQVIFALGWSIFNPGKEFDVSLFDSWQILWTNLIIYVFTLLIMAYFIRRSGGRYSQLGFKKFKLNKPNINRVLSVLGITTFVSFLALIILSLFVNGSTIKQAQDTGYDSVAGWGSLLPVFIGLVIAAPIAEELVFRGFIYQGLRKKLSLWPAAVISSLLFALVHGQFNVGITVFIMALGACWLIEKTGSIYSSILLHMLKNLIAFSLVFVFV